MLELMNNMFDDFYRDLSVKGNMPTDIEETDKEYIVSVNVPGVNKENINISFDDSYLTINVNNSNEEKEDDNNYIRHEIRSYDMSRSYYLDDVDENSIKAKLVDGVLTINITKMEKKTPEKKLIAIE